MIRFALPLALGLVAGAAAAHPAMTAEDTAMRAAPSARARIVQQIPARAQIDVGDCGDVWCHASWRDLDGYVRAEAIGPNEAPLEGAPVRRYYYGGPVFVAPLFGFGWGGYYRRW